MSSTIRRYTDSLMITGVGYLVILGVAILGIQLVEPGFARIVTLALLALFTILFALIPAYEAPAWRIHIQIGLMTVVVVGLMVRGHEWSVFPTLFFGLSPIAMMAFPTQVAIKAQEAGLLSTNPNLSL